MFKLITDQDITDLDGNDFYIQLDNERQAKVVLFCMSMVFERWKALEIKSHETELTLLKTRYNRSNYPSAEIDEVVEIIENLKSSELVCINNQVRIKDNSQSEAPPSGDAGIPLELRIPLPFEPESDFKDVVKLEEKPKVIDKSAFTDRLNSLIEANANHMHNLTMATNLPMQFTCDKHPHIVRVQTLTGEHLGIYLGEYRNHKPQLNYLIYTLDGIKMINFGEIKLHYYIPINSFTVSDQHQLLDMAVEYLQQQRESELDHDISFGFSM